ncbi:MULTISPECIES: hypothetical protein [Rhodopseudomonas]|uniref:Uncharacterized protein n=1 Tax=Rhodopseudomonas palustris TaxID=1076 RepID=A0A0D7F2W2_RHOPL|nr:MULTISPECIES: hypothetical protein [Rhodopseudomonas]KIZ47384.1 hypothetical protein OO17_04560 [Rhodopseudomonas palustris]MDF3809272.1 hypothetical protein [Rhodopseudomonas sp. BAL398]WOK19044.1 hypothetical protein RBJ75_05865 [Rhodopseudomonas sp. BAL398]
MTKTEHSDEDKAHIALVDRYLRPGDLLTYTVCMGRLREAIYEYREGYWIIGKPTRETRDAEGWKGREFSDHLEDISPRHVTHINRDPVEAIPMLIEIDPKWQHRAEA